MGKWPVLKLVIVPAESEAHDVNGKRPPPTGLCGHNTINQDTHTRGVKRGVAFTMGMQAGWVHVMSQAQIPIATTPIQRHTFAISGRY